MLGGRAPHAQQFDLSDAATLVARPDRFIPGWKRTSPSSHEAHQAHRKAAALFAVRRPTNQAPPGKKPELRAATCRSSKANSLYSRFLPGGPGHQGDCVSGLRGLELANVIFGKPLKVLDELYFDFSEPANIVRPESFLP